MVFCGRPSKACHRCRDRRLNCDLHKPSCGQCERAQVACPGYRETQGLRIRDESQAVRRKAISRARNATAVEPRSLALSIEWQARDAFFVNHVTGTSKTWDFLTRFYDQTQTPEHLAMSIDAVSLAYLAHQVSSDAALATAREKYMSALRMTNKALRSPELAAKDTTLLASLLLDLFEKITNNEPRHDIAWTGHVHGALALVRLQGLEHFQDPTAVRILVRLSTNLLISCVASGSPVPSELIALRAYAAQHLNAGDPKWRLSDLMVDYANLQSAIRRCHLSIDDSISLALELDTKLQALALDMPLSWLYKTTCVEGASERIYGNYFDSYPDRHTTQTWNVLRLVRILLNESVIEHCLASSCEFTLGVCSPLIKFANANIETLACEICASVPQYIDCRGEARGCSLPSEKSDWPEGVDHVLIGTSHSHSTSQNLDCYTLIFPLYVAGRSRGSPEALKLWVTEQLRYISSHFDIRNAALVGQILEQGTDVSPWTVYAMLGSYAFAA